MQVKSIAECSKGSILQYFRPSLTFINLPVVIKTFILSILEWPFYCSLIMTLIYSHIKGKHILFFMCISILDGDFSTWKQKLSF